MRLIRFVFIACFLNAGLYVSAQEWLVPADKRVKLSPHAFNDSTQTAGKATFEANCVICHGNPGKGNFNNALVPPPPDPISDKMQKNTDGELFFKITEGRGQMSKFKDILTPEEIWGVISYIRSFNKNYVQRIEQKIEKTGYGGTVKILISYLADKNQLQTVVMGTRDNKTLPLAGVELKLFAQRRFGNLPLDEEKATNEKGVVSFLLPKNLPGDSAGFVNFVVKISDQDLYGQVSADSLLAAGIPSKRPSLVAKRAMFNVMWKAPVWLLITYFAGVLIAWGVIFYIVFLIRKIYLIGKLNDENNRKLPEN